MLQGRGPATPPVLTDAGLRGAVVIVTGGGSSRNMGGMITGGTGGAGGASGDGGFGNGGKAAPGAAPEEVF